MCGRYALHSNLSRLLDSLAVREWPPFPARYNIAPTQDAPVIVGPEDGAVLARWGLVPHWSKGPDSRYSMINARAETLEAKPAYRDAWRRRRCLVPADGFFEWRREGNRKQPYYIHAADHAPLTFAGLWAVWRDPGGGELRSFTIVTTGANDLMRPIHDRMPVIVDAGDRRRWLTAGTPPGDLLVPAPADRLAARPVSSRVNSPAHDAPDCIEAATP